MTDDQESHSGSEILIWRNGNEKRLNREPHNDSRYSFGGEDNIWRSPEINELNLSSGVSAYLLR